MNCKKCKYCVQVSANEYKVRCRKAEVAENDKCWVPEPSYCVHYLDKSLSSQLKENRDIINDTLQKENKRLIRFLKQEGYLEEILILGSGGIKYDKPGPKLQKFLNEEDAN